MPTRFRPFTSVAAAVLAAVLTGGAVAGCGGGSHSYKAGTPAATGNVPDCSVVPIDVVTSSLAIPLTGPAGGARPGGGYTCTYVPAKGVGSAPELMQLGANVTPQSFALVRNGLKAANNPIKTIHGWGDEAWAATVYNVVNENSFAVRKGKVSVLIQSTADYDHIKKLMKAVLAKL